MRRMRGWLLVGTVLLGISAGVRAETLGQAIADAYQYNPRLQAQRAALRAIDENVIQAGAAYRLNASANALVYYSSQDVRSPLTDHFFPERTREMSGYVSASQILSNGGRTAAQVSVAEASELAGREKLRETENETLLEVVDSYVSVRRDQDLVDIEFRSVESYRRQVDQAVAREKGGDLTRTDIAQAQAQLEIARSQLSAAQAQLQQSRARFAAVVGRNPGTLDPEPALPGLPATLDDAYRVGEKESPVLWQAILSERAAADQVSAERAERRPVVSVTGQVGIGSNSSYDPHDAGLGYTGQVTLTVPLLTGGVVDSRVRAAIATRQQQQFLIEDTRRAVDVEIQNSWNQSITARDQVAAGEAGVSAATLALEGVKRGFAEGFRSNFEVLDSEQRLLNAQIIVATARYSRYATQATLLATLGRLEAAAIDQAITAYDATANLDKQRHRQFGPFQTVLIPLDKMLKPSDHTAPAPTLPPAGNTAVLPAVVPPPEGGLGTTLPVQATDRPVQPPSSTPPPPALSGPIAAPHNTK